MNKACKIEILILKNLTLLHINQITQNIFAHVVRLNFLFTRNNLKINKN